jgi:Xaa-Pro aminopeptidase
MHTYFGPDFFSTNRAKLRAALGNDIPIVIAGNGLMQRSADEAYKFQQDSNFWYLTGVSSPDLTLVMTRDDTYLMVPSLSSVREAFDGAHDVAAYAATSGITDIVSDQDGWQRLRGALAGSTAVATCAALPSYSKPHGLYVLPFRRKLIERLKRLQPGLAVQDIRLPLATLRSVKQPEELHALQRAIKITTDTLQDITLSDAFAQATHEYQLEAALSYGFRSRGADGHAFPPIVGAGAHSTTLHHMDNNGPIEPGDLIVLDVGAAVDHYAADITRTVSRQPVTGRKADVFTAVCMVQDYALSLIKPGILLTEYEKAIELYMGQQLQKLGLIRDSKKESIRHYFPHATSHFLGLDTHDVGDYRVPLQENMVITCEPGIYIPEEGIGVRIEDDILITTAGNTVLSAACPRGLTAVQ